MPVAWKTVLTVLLTWGLAAAALSATDREAPTTRPTGKAAVWTLNSIVSVGGHPVRAEGSPRVIDTDKGKAVLFDGKRDALFVDVNPLEGLATFTLEAVFRPDANGAVEQRFFHAQQEGKEDRALLETRMGGDGTWYMDTCVRSGRGLHALNNPKLTHPLGQWHCAALVYDGRQMVQYVNGVKELSKDIAFSPLEKGKASIGSRMNKVSWFKGAVRLIRVTPGVLPPEEMLKP
jgi:hypothetical protein